MKATLGRKIYVGFIGGVALLSMPFFMRSVFEGERVRWENQQNLAYIAFQKINTNSTVTFEEWKAYVAVGGYRK
jgi:hypothetical protein